MPGNPKWEAHSVRAGKSARKKAARHRYNRRFVRRVYRVVADVVSKIGLSGYLKEQP